MIYNRARRAGGQVVREICVVVFSLTRSVSFYGTQNWNLSENSVSILFVGDGFPVPLHSGLFTASPNLFGRFFRLLREAKRLPYAPTNSNLAGSLPP